ncbi:hypothetical protein CBS115989_9477 [Aspergillus niger]|nr:hypothetical protein CBS115989_9477 [Aspergillus niger]KAI2840529.1 hypothetical protein CBS11232_9085 [Aspergillus niger]KAI2873545.1 hypothetical protein CBS115988_6984 [Aspergillus niger]
MVRLYSSRVHERKSENCSTIPYTLPVAIINDTEDVLTVIEKTCWYYANSGAWTEDAGHKLTLTLGGSGTSGMLRIRASSGHTFSVVVGYHN